MTISKLYISHSKYKFNNRTKLLDCSNLSEILSSLKEEEYHTSINDLGYKNIQKAVQHAKEIILIDLNVFKNELIDNDYFVYGRLVNELYRVREKVRGFEWVDNFHYTFFNDTIQKRESNNTLLWTSGCSVTYGTGIERHERWGYLLSKLLNLTEVSISNPGASIAWATDQILRSDLRSGDIVVWGLTDISRVEYAKNWQLYAIPVTGYSQLPENLQHYNLDYFDSQTKFVQAIKNILQVKNYCDKVGAKLFLANLLDSTYFNCVFSSLSNYIDFCIESPYNNKLEFLDLGSDNSHPGPKQHQYYAEKIYQLIKENNHGKTF